MHEPGERTRFQIIWRMLAVVFGIVMILGVCALVVVNFLASNDEAVLGPHLSKEARAEIDAADCTGLQHLATGYAPNADSVRDASEASDRINERAKQLGCFT